ncbi:Tetratricopeptide repeat-containing protein [Oceanobacillus limi]|uniref:Tetratricopeptide repeat-containing protein n=1 Tax=Oceanobacillus limi TaxID=930131 RepID=A0A1I0H321_9BACI|nr:tetratricopeptide repeat protein [Oceanobacillus limi]SET77948.1 Tetratricopeptide repeat-containing protein [Oceanobacillus limi]
MDKNTKAIELMKENKYEEAAAIFNEVIQEQPNDPLGYINFGNLLLHVKDPERAQRFFDKAIELDEKSATAYYGLGNLYFEQAEYKKAQVNFQQAIELGLEEADVYFMMGMTFQHQEHHKLALPYFLRATELKQDDVEMNFQYGLALAQSNLISDAKKVFEDVLSKDEKHSDAHYNLGVIAIYNEQAESALHHFNQALEIQPDHVLAANGKSQLEQLMEEKDT